MKNISRLLIILLSASFILSSCEDEDVQRFPDFTTPVVLLADNTSAAIVINDVGTPLETGLEFNLSAENFDGSADGHKFFVGRSGATSTLIDVTFIANYSGVAGTASGELFTLQASELPSAQSITLTQMATAVGLNVDDIDGGDVIVLTYEYRIDANNTGDIRQLGTPSSDYCGGFTSEGEFCAMTVNVICTQVIANPPGDYTLNMFDSFGDGWNNSQIRVVVDGVGTDYTFDDGDSDSQVVTVPSGAQTLTFEYVSGDFDSEVSFEIIAPSGNMIAADGPSPSIGTILLNLCNE